MKDSYGEMPGIIVAAIADAADYDRRVQPQFKLGDILANAITHESAPLPPLWAPST
jgi:hypothetical protein